MKKEEEMGVLKVVKIDKMDLFLKLWARVVG
jgi:hypothetical protein